MTWMAYASFIINKFFIKQIYFGGQKYLASIYKKKILSSEIL